MTVGGTAALAAALAMASLSPAGGCNTDLDCALAGRCVSSSLSTPRPRATTTPPVGTGTCACKPGWANGAAGACERLRLGETTTAIRYPNSSVTGHTGHDGAAATWTWGGTPSFDKATGRCHLYFSYLTHGCGLLHYQVCNATQTVRPGRCRVDTSSPSGPMGV